MDDSSAVCCAAGYDSFSSVCIETCYVAVSCVDEYITDRRHFGGDRVEMDISKRQQWKQNERRGGGGRMYLLLCTSC